MQLQPIGLIGATLFIQLCLLILLTITNRMLPEKGFLQLRSKCDRAVLALAIITVGCLVVSDELYRSWAPILGDLAFQTGIGRSVTYIVLFTTDLMVAFYLVASTGGSKSSPYTAVLFLLPSLSIFLREPPSRFIWYSIAAAIFFLLGLAMERSRFGPIDVLRGPEGIASPYSMLGTGTPAHAIVNLGCLFIATATGYITRQPPL